MTIGSFDRFTLPAYESSAVASLRTIYAANAGFAQGHPQQGYAFTFGQLVSHVASPDLPEWAIDPALGSGQKNGYSYRYVPHEKKDGKVDAYEVFADPLKPSKLGARHFFSDQTGIIRVSDGGPASKVSKALN